jgi:hypothetical protein
VTRPTRADAGGRAYLDLQNLARRQGRPTQSLLVLYVLERFLARLAASAYADLFVLRGGMLLAVWDARRATVDGDFLARNLCVDETTVLARVVEIVSTQPLVEDGVTYLVDTATASTIRDGDLYGGVRVSMDATVAGAQVKLRLDVSTGDPIPPPDVISYPTLRPHHPALRILGYPLVVVLAEKLCTAVELGAGNSRLRDYADVWTLTGLHDINGNELAGALEATAAHRGVELRPLSQLVGDYATERASGYAAYLRRLGPDATRLPRTLSDVIDGVVAFADPFPGPNGCPPDLVAFHPSGMGRLI